MLKDLFKKKEIEYSDKDRIDNEEIKDKASPKGTTKEIWKDVVDFERFYEVSNLGNIRRVNLDGSRRPLKPTIDKTDGCVKIGLNKNGKTKYCMMSKVVAQAFNLPNPQNKKFVYHIDRDKTNNSITNLTYNYEEVEKEVQEETINVTLEGSNITTSIDNTNVVRLDIQKPITINDIYEKLNDILEELKKRG